MKILKKGKPEPLLRGTCRDCGTKVECRKAEATWLEDRPGEMNACYGIVCPNSRHCDSYIYLR